MEKAKKVILIIAFLFVLFPVFSYGEEDTRPTETEYPYVGETPGPTDVSYGIDNYVKYLFVFVISIIGILIFASLVYNGLRYMLSADNPEKRREAIAGILAAFGGAIFLFASYLILNTINPDLLDLTPDELAEIPYPPLAPGPYICNFKFENIQSILNDYEDKEKRNDVIKEYHDTIKAEDDRSCLFIKNRISDLKNSGIGRIEPGINDNEYTYFVIPKIGEGGSTIDDKEHGIIIFQREIDKHAKGPLGSPCSIFIGNPTGASSSHYNLMSSNYTNFDNETGGINPLVGAISVAPIKLNIDGSNIQRAIFYEDEDANKKDDGGTYPDSDKPKGYHEVSISTGKHAIRGYNYYNFDNEFLCGDDFSSPVCGIRSVRLTEDMFTIFISDHQGDFLCYLYENNNNLTNIPTQTVSSKNFRGFNTIPKITHIHIIKGNLY